jgi:hypothetical protein
MLSELTIQRPKLAPYQTKILESKARFTVTEAATKVGKTFTHLWWLFEKAHTPPKKGANYWWIAPVYSQAKIAFSRLRRVVAASGLYRINESELFIQTPAGSTIWFKSAEKPDNLYGEDVYAAVFDEFTRAREEAWIALRTTLTATKAPCKFIGNVKGKKNWGYKLGMKARNGEPGYEYFKVTAYDAAAAGILSLEEIEQAKRDLPESAFRELYLAEALEDGANPFGYTFIQKQIRPISKLPPVCFGIDLAKSVDWTVVIGLDKDRQVCFFERWQSDWGQTRRRIKDIVKHLPAYIDSTGVGDPIVEDIQLACNQVEGYHFNPSSKQQLMEGLANSIQKGEISVLDGVMKEEMEAFEFEYGRTGVKYSAPQGFHDDTVCALALADSKYKTRPKAPILTFHR